MMQGIQPPTGLNLSAKHKAANWKVYKQQWENYSIAAQLEKQNRRVQSGTISLLDRTRRDQDIQQL